MSISSMLSSRSTMCTDQQLVTAKNYICPKCNKPYDFQVTTNNVIIGRIPLILNCKHCTCLDCVYKMYPSKNIICGECHASNFITDVEAKKKPDQFFSINYYIIGALFCQRPCKFDNSTYNMKPAGCSFSPGIKRRQEQRPNSFLQFNMNSNDQNSVNQLNLNLQVSQNVCCQERCKKEAELNCLDCDEMYCKQCSDTLHNSAKGLKKHKISQLSSGDSLELKHTCSVHADSVIEFCCKDCERNLCCYCVITEHNGHNYYQMTELTEDNMEEFKSLVEDAEQVLKKLHFCERKGRHLYGKAFNTPTNNTSIEFTISKKINNAIVKLQILEKEFLTEAQRYRNQDSSALINILETVTANIRSVSSLINISRQVLNKRTASKKFNIHLLNKQLKEVCDETACYLLQNADKSDSEIDFVFEDSLIDDLQHSSTLKFTKDNSYTLVTQKDLPPDYEEEETEYLGNSPISMSSASSFPEFPDKSKDNARNKKTFKTDNIEKWIKTNNENANKRHKTQKEHDLVATAVPILVQGDRETVKVSHLTSPDCFYVQLVRLNGALNRLNRNIDKHIKNSVRTSVQAPEINSLYMVKYIYNGQINWCRGRLIEENSEQRMYVVFFIDYGNTGNVRKEDIIMMPPDLQKQAPLAIQCKFFDLYPVKGEWDPKVLLLMTRIIANNELLMIVTGRMTNTLEIDLITMDCDTSVRDALTFLGYGIPYCRNATELDRIKKELKNMETVKLYNKTEQYKKEDSMDVIICYAIDPYNIYVNMKNSKNDLIKLHEAMHNFYKQNDKGFVYSPKKDMVVAVLYSDGVSSSWRRGIITESTEGKATVTARLVDIGMIYSVPWDQVRKLDGRFTAQDCQAKLVKMTDIIPPNGAALWPQNAIDFFTKYIKAETVLRMVISEITNPPEVVLFKCFPAVHYCLNATLVKEGLAESTGDLSIAVEWPQIYYEPSSKVDDSFTLSMMKTIQTSTNQNKTSKNAASDNDDDEDDDEDDTKVWRKPIELISAESPDLIYVRFIDDKEKFHEFQLELKHFYSKNKLASAKWQVGSVCVVHHKKNYYRGLIREILDEEKFTVALGDVALTIEAGKKQLGMLDTRFMKVPEFTMRCHLADITPAGDTKKWSAMACEFLQDLFKKNTQLYLGKKGVVDKERKSMPAVIWFTEFLPGSALESSKTVLHSVNKLLLKNGLALKTAVKKMVKNDTGTNEKASESDKKETVTSPDLNVNVNGDEIKTNDEEDDLGDEELVTSQSTEMEDHQMSSSDSASSVAGALQPSSHTKIDWNDLIEMQKQCSEQIIKDWVAPLPFRSQEFEAIPTFVNDNGEIFLHDIELEPILRDMEDKMYEYFESRDVVDVDECWAPGEMCSVRYFVNKKWYRGKILTVNGSEIKVIMVDYGNEDECGSKDLSKEILYYDLPVFANKVVLNNVYPKQNKWLTSDLDKLHAQIVDKRVTVSLKSQQIAGLPTPAVLKLENMCINDSIMLESLNLSRLNRPKCNATATSSSVEVVNDILIANSDVQSDNDVIIEETGSSTDEFDVEDNIINYDDVVLNYKQAPLPELKPGEKFNVAVINVLDYNKIILETSSTANIETGKEFFEHMSKDINFFVPEQEVLETFETGKVCIARYSEDGQWYRAQIIKEIDDEQVYVWFVDFGNFENTSKSTVKELQEEWMVLPVEQRLATIDDIVLADPNNRRRVLNHILSYCETVHRAAVVSREPLCVKLYKEGTDELSYQHLLDAGLLVCAEKVVVESEEGKGEEKEEVEEEKKEGKEEAKVAEEELKQVEVAE